MTIVLALISPHVRNLWTKNCSRQHQTALTPAIVRIDYRFLDNRSFSANLTRKVMFRSIDRLVIVHQLLHIKSVVQEERRLTFSAIFILIISNLEKKTNSTKIYLFTGFSVNKRNPLSTIGE